MTRAEHEFFRAERVSLSTRMVSYDEIRSGWTRFNRPGNRVRIKLLRYLNKTTTGRFAIGKKYIAFENGDDALMYKIAYPS